MVKGDDNQLIVIFFKMQNYLVLDVILKSLHKNELCYGTLEDRCENLN